MILPRVSALRRFMFARASRSASCASIWAFRSSSRVFRSSVAREATTGQEIGQSPEIDREAENSPVEGRDAGRGETAPESEQATHAQPEAAQEVNSGEGQEPKPWTKEERQARIDAERDRQTQIERERGSNDNDRGREME
jgi:hypothetical protein